MLLDQGKAKIEKNSALGFEKERQRLLEAIEMAMVQLEELTEKCREEYGNETASPFEFHRMFIEDEDYAACLLTVLEEGNCTAEYAVQQTGEQFAALFAAKAEPGMQALERNIRDISGMILNHLMGIPAIYDL